MSLLKSIFQFIFSIYFLIVFFVVTAVGLIVYRIQYFFFKTKHESVYKFFLFRGIGTVTHLLAFINVEKKHHHKYSEDKAYVVVGNHNANIDIPINTSSCPSEINMKFLSKIENTKLPVLGPIVKGMCVIVDRESIASRQETFKLMEDELKKGYSIFLYPEGTRNKTDEQLKNFYNGAFSLAIEHQLPIVVNTLVGTKKVNSSKKALSILPGKVTSHWEAPIPTKGMTKDDIPYLKEQVRAIMIARLEA
jgi:1-acyl-sn-glycerol-3-phosphate acyltransferase